MTYVCGFMFDPMLTHVVLIEKKRPEWQRGKLNGVGGKIEERDVTSLNAMIREFHEETGVMCFDWKKFVRLEDMRGHAVDFFFAVSEKYFDVRTKTDETIFPTLISEIWIEKPLPNVRWLIEMALSIASGRETRARYFTITENLSE